MLQQYALRLNSFRPRSCNQGRIHVLPDGFLLKLIKKQLISKEGSLTKYPHHFTRVKPCEVMCGLTCERISHDSACEI